MLLLFQAVTQQNPLYVKVLPTAGALRVAEDSDQRGRRRTLRHPEWHRDGLCFAVHSNPADEENGS